MDRYICEACGRRYPQRGDCQDHPEEPLQDLADEDVRLMLEDFDSARKRKRLGLLGGICAVLLSPLVIFIPVRQLGLLAWIAASGALAGGLYKFFPARQVMPNLKAESPEWMF